MKIIVFAGGVGTRLWPLSRKNTPKQFGKIIGDQSTLQQTVERLLPEFPAEDIFIATGKSYKNIVLEQLPTIPQENFIFEPKMRDVGPAIGLMSFLLEKKFPSEPIGIIWSDHLVKNEVLFRNILRLAAKKVDEGLSKFIFIGQTARFPNQNCGWIELGERITDEQNVFLYAFKKLSYRPTLDEAKIFFKNKNSIWNLGYFVTTPNFLTSLFHTYVPEMARQLSKIANTAKTSSFEETLENIYPSLEKISFDDAILVKLPAHNIHVISADLGWSDIGTWDALKEALSSHINENITAGNVLLEQTNDTLIFNYNNQMCVGIDLHEMVIINTDDVLLICPKGSVPKIKKFVENLSGTTNEHLA